MMEESNTVADVPQEAVEALLQRAIRNALIPKLNNQKTPRSAPAVVVFFVLRLILYGGVIYGSLKCFQGSVIALLCGLGLAALAVGWEAVRILRD
jgi:hypothetical protein